MARTYKISLLAGGFEKAFQFKAISKPCYELANALVVLNCDSPVSSWTQSGNIFYFNLQNGFSYEVIFYLVPAEPISFKHIKSALRCNSQFKARVGR